MDEVKMAWCARCQTWVKGVRSSDREEALENLEKAKSDHLRWCGLEEKTISEHPDLVELNRFLETMFG